MTIESTLEVPSTRTMRFMGVCVPVLDAWGHTGGRAWMDI